MATRNWNIQGMKMNTVSNADPAQAITNANVIVTFY